MTLTTLSAPSEAKEAFNRAEQAMAQEVPDQAASAEALLEAVKIYPEFALAWNRLGNLRMSQGDTEGARHAFQQAIAADGEFFGPIAGLTQMEIQAKNWTEAGKHADRLLELLPEHPHAQYLNGLLYYNQKRHTTAQGYFKKIEDAGQTAMFPMTHFFLGAILMAQNKIPEAASQFRSYLTITPEEMIPENLKAMLGQQLDSWESQGLLEPETPSVAAAPESQ